MKGRCHAFERLAHAAPSVSVCLSLSVCLVQHDMFSVYVNLNSLCSVDTRHEEDG